MSIASPTPGASVLRLVPGTAERAQPTRWFCDACGASPAQPGPPPPFARACERCGDGRLVEAACDVAPRDGDAFLVLDAALGVRSCSPGAASLLGRSTVAAGTPVGELLEGADAEAAAGLAPRLVAIAGGEEPTAQLTVRPAGEFGVRLTVSAGVCGPPRGVLLVLDRRPVERRATDVVDRTPAARANRHLRVVG